MIYDKCFEDGSCATTKRIKFVCGNISLKIENVKQQPNIKNVLKTRQVP